MTRILSILTALLAMAGLCACSDNDNPSPSLGEGFACGPTELLFRSEGSDVTVTVRAAQTPTASTDAAWLTLAAPQAGDKGTWTITATASANPTAEMRRATVTVKAGADQAVLNATQVPGDGGETPDVPTPPTPPEPGGDNEAQLGLTAAQIAADMGTGINIGNTLEAMNGSIPSETAWGNPPVNETYVQGLKDAGFKSVRIPCAWDGYVTDRATNTIDPAWLDRVDEVVGMVTSRGMYAVLNIHWDGGWLENHFTGTVNADILARQTAYWTQIAKRLGHYNEMLLFAGTNEPSVDNAAKMAELLVYEQAFIDAVRATGGNNAVRTLVFQGPTTDINKTVSLMKELPHDTAQDRLMAEIHYYDPWQFCGLEADADWGKQFWFWGEPNLQPGHERNTPSWGLEASMASQFDKMKTKFTDKGIPVIIGEYGALIHETQLKGATEAEKEAHFASRVYYDALVAKRAKERGQVPFLWDTGEIMDRTTGQPKRPEIVNAIMEAVK